MRYGVSFSLDLPQQVRMTKEAGFDYAECGFGSLSRADDKAFVAYRDALRENDIPCEAANCFIPGDLPIIGTDYARKEMRDYIENGMRRGAPLGLRTVAFGSGWSRSLPKGVPFNEGFRQLGAFLRDVVSPIAAAYGVTVAIEPLRKDECNIIHTLDEGVMLAALADRENISCLADVYHMWGAGDSFDDLRKLRGCIAHGHISNPETLDKEAKRTFPLDKKEFDYKGFVEALRDAGCERCSIEARVYDFPTEIQKAGAVLKSLL